MVAHTKAMSAIKRSISSQSIMAILFFTGDLIKSYVLSRISLTNLNPSPPLDRKIIIQIAQWTTRHPAYHQRHQFLQMKPSR